MIEVRHADPLSQEALRLIAGSEQELSALYAPEVRFAFSPEKLVFGGVRFYVAGRDGGAQACGGYGVYDGFAEMKRIFVAPELRGRRLADAVVARLETDAAAEGLPLMRLETGLASPAAIRFYERMGYAHIPAFPPYFENGSGVFMEKPLCT